jgi:hypothetical protein
MKITVDGAPVTVDPCVPTCSPWPKLGRSNPCRAGQFYIVDFTEKAGDDSHDVPRQREVEAEAVVWDVSRSKV